MKDEESDDNELQAAVRAGAEAAVIEDRVKMLEVLGIDLPVHAEGTSVKVLGTALALAEERQAGPRRRSGTIVLAEVASFIGYVNRYKDADRSVIYADVTKRSVTCVFDDHLKGPKATDAAWRGHRAAYFCPLAPEWVRWCGFAGQKLTQTQLADIIDAHLLDLTAGDGTGGFPKPTELLEMARSLQITVGQKFKRVIDPRLGTTSLVSEMEHSAESTKIPRAFLLALRVFEGGEVWQVEARLRFEMPNGAPVFTFELHRKEETERDAFGNIRASIATETELPLFAGVPG